MEQHVRAPTARPHVEVPDAVRGGRGLSVELRRATRALAEAMFLRESGPPGDDELDWLCDDLDHFFRHAGARARFVFWLCVTAIHRVSPWLVRRVGPLSQLDLRARGDALARMERGPLALAVFGAKAILCVVYYEHPVGARWAGYDGACLTRRSAPP